LLEKLERLRLPEPVDRGRDSLDRDRERPRSRKRGRSRSREHLKRIEEEGNEKVIIIDDDINDIFRDDSKHADNGPIFIDPNTDYRYVILTQNHQK
jgi:hypothetical protein